MIDPATRARLPALREAWRERRSLRIEPFLAAGLADELLETLRGLPHVIRSGAPPGLGYLYHELALVPDESCDHVSCRLARWLFGDGRAWLSALTGMPLHPPPDGHLVATAYGKGCHLDAHNDADGSRAVAYVLGLTPQAWPEEEGGHLEFLDTAATDGEPLVVERRRPGWNTLDLFDVRERTRIHRIPLLTEHRERRVFSGWFHGAPG